MGTPPDGRSGKGAERRFVMRFKHFFRDLALNWRVQDLLDTKTPHGRGRIVLISAGTLSIFSSTLSAGTFYSGFLLANGIEIVNIGIIGMAPLLANFFTLFAPLILEKIPKRKWLLVGGRIIFHLLNIGAVTLLPYIGGSTASKVTLVVVFAFTANFINVLSSVGFSVWHMAFLEERLRKEYYAFTLIYNGVIQTVCLLISGLAADRLSAAGDNLSGLILMRNIALVIALAEALLYAIPKEFPYPKSAGKLSLVKMLTNPFRQKKFIFTMAIVALWNFSANISASPATVYLLDNVGVSYLFINAMTSLNVVMMIIAMPFWKKVLSKYSWFNTFTFAEITYVIHMVLFACITSSNYRFVYPLDTIFIYASCVGVSLTAGNFAYINTPAEDQSNYISFYICTANVAAFLGQMSGTVFLGLTEGLSIPLGGGSEICNIQMLFLLQAAVYGGVFVAVRKIIPIVSPEEPKVPFTLNPVALCRKGKALWSLSMERWNRRKRNALLIQKLWKESAERRVVKASQREAEKESRADTTKKGGKSS